MHSRIPGAGLVWSFAPYEVISMVRVAALWLTSPLAAPTKLLLVARSSTRRRLAPRMLIVLAFHTGQLAVTGVLLTLFRPRDRDTATAATP